MGLCEWRCVVDGWRGKRGRFFENFSVCAGNQGVAGRLDGFS